MSLTILIVAACHAIPPIAVASVGKTKGAAYVGAAIGAAIAIAAGSPAYIAADLAGVAFGTWLGLAIVQPKRE